MWKFQNRVVQTLSILSEVTTISVQKHVQQPTIIDYNKLKPCFGWVSAETITKPFKTCTQWEATSTRFHLRKHFKSRLHS